MDVQCERCKTEYEFDDALVSGRGTTVRCTSCGHQFKVRRPQGPEAANDRWIVRTGDGRQLTFLTLRELQRAILAHQLARADLIMRSGAPPRPLGSITELEPFFQGRTSSRPPPAGTEQATAPIAFPKNPSPWERDLVPVASAPPATVSYGADAPPMRGKIETLRPTGAAAPPQAVVQPQPILQPATYVQPGSVGRGVAMVRSTPGAAYPVPPYYPQQEEPLAPPAVPEISSPLPAPTRPMRWPLPTGDDEVAEMRGSMPSATDEPYSAHRGRRVGGWIVALVLLLAVGVVGWAVAKPYVLARNAGAAAQLDPRALSFLSDGERAMADGNLEVAQRDFDKASALAERDPRVLLDEARVAAAQADVPWLKLRLISTDASDEMRTTNAQLLESMVRAQRAADDALSVAPEDPATVRAKIDTLRLSGDRERARAYVAKVIAQASQPETAYVLAALDLAEPEPLWTTVIERLRMAAAGEGNAGRARAALVYALAKSGDVAAAKAELAKLDTLARPYPVLPNLHAMVDRMAAKPPLGAVAGNSAAPSASAAPVAAQAPPSGAPAPAGAGGEAAGDTRGGMQAASQAIKKGDWTRAREIYQAIVARNPGDSEAVAGIGDVARAQGDSAGAIAAYKRAIGVNPSYLPALLGLADTEWTSGDHASAVRGYTDIVDRFPEGTYPAYVKQRTEGGASKASPPAVTKKGSPPGSPDEPSE